MPRDAAPEEPTQHAKPATPADERENVAEQPTLHADSAEHEVAPDGHVDWQGREVRGRYRVGEKLGEGGMGMVYVAEHIHLRKKVAFKVIHPSLASNEELLARFTREALATGQLEHAHICAAIDFEQLPDGSAFLVMPFVRGHSLQVTLDSSGPMAWRDVCRLGAQIADALSAAHAVGIVHRDLKPDNVLIEELPDGSRAAKVLDFGVASLTGAAQSIPHIAGRPLTQAGMILGTPGYMSPEQATAGEIDGRTDLYALGVILWEACAGRRLFDGDDVTRIFARQFRGAPDAPGLDQVGPPRELAELTMRLLAADREQRPATAAEVRDQLRRLAEAPEPGVVQRTGAHGLRLARERWQQLPQRTRRGVAGAALALLGVLLLWFSFSGGEPGQESDAAARAAGAAAKAEQAKSPSAAEEQAPDDSDEPAEAPASEAKEESEKRSKSLIDGVKGLLGSLPKELAEARETLFEADARQERADAAQRLLDHEPAEEVPEYLRLSAELELSRGCRAKRSVLRELIELGDDGALPAVERLDAVPRRSCGFLKLRDCFACMRADIEEALEVLD